MRPAMHTFAEGVLTHRAPYAAEDHPHLREKPKILIPTRWVNRPRAMGQPPNGLTHRRGGLDPGSSFSASVQHSQRHQAAITAGIEPASILSCCPLFSTVTKWEVTPMCLKTWSRSSICSGSKRPQKQFKNNLKIYPWRLS